MLIAPIREIWILLIILNLLDNYTLSIFYSIFLIFVLFFWSISYYLLYHRVSQYHWLPRVAHPGIVTLVIPVPPHLQLHLLFIFSFLFFFFSSSSSSHKSASQKPSIKSNSHHQTTRSIVFPHACLHFALSSPAALHRGLNFFHLPLFLYLDCFSSSSSSHSQNIPPNDIRDISIIFLLSYSRAVLSVLFWTPFASSFDSHCHCHSHTPPTIKDMIHSAGEERAELLAREAVELFDAGHREV